MGGVERKIRHRSSEGSSKSGPLVCRIKVDTPKGGGRRERERIL